MFTVRNCLTDIYLKMGNLSKTQVDLPVVLSRLYSVINRRMAQMNLSTNNWVLSYVDVEDSDEFRNVLPALNFSNVVTVELINSDDEDALGQPIEVINATNLANARIDGKRAIGFYIDNDTGDWMYGLTFKGFEGMLRIWYEPNSPVPAGIINNVKIKSIFKDLITSETAYFLMDYTKGLSVDLKMSIKQSLFEDKQLWDAEWVEEMQKGRQIKNAVRTPFRAGF